MNVIKLLWVAAGFLALAGIDSAFAVLYSCTLPIHFSAGKTLRDSADVYHSRMTVNVPDYDFNILIYPGVDTITFTASAIAITFHGNVVYDMPSNPNLPARPITQNLLERISGVAQRFQLNDTNADISDCHVYLFGTGLDRPNMPNKIIDKIRVLAEHCVQSVVCNKISQLSAIYKMEYSNKPGLAQLPGLSGPMPYRPTFHGLMPFQHAINTLIDDGLSHFTSALKASRQNKVELPKIVVSFQNSGLVKSKGHFLAGNGTFGNLVNLVRASAPTVLHEGNRFVISSNFQINSANMSYTYKVKNGLTSSKGKLKASVGTVKLEARFAADYSSKPCIATVTHLKITEFANITTSYTGVTGIFKSAVAKRNWFDNKTLSAIEETIVQHLRFHAESRLRTYNCERFRS